MKHSHRRLLLIVWLCSLLGGCNHSPTDLLNILRAYPDYAFEDTSALPNFAYADAADPNLRTLRATYNLEAVAGNGDELSRILNLMRWVHTTIRHDGNAANPYPFNALNILQLAIAENRSVNCRMIAIVLNEVYLSLGFQSRYVSGMPAAEMFSDSHVINAVYAETLRQWLYMDASFEGYFTDEFGNFLSVQALRDRLLDGQFVQPNPAVNHNGKPFDDYTGYMTKNLFRLESPVNSAFDYESQTTGLAYIQLVPAGYRDNLEPTTGISNSGSPLTVYYTSNPDFFWER